MFLSTYTPKLDEKGRFFLPPKYRPQLAEGLVITCSFDDCLAIYPMAAFQQLSDRILDKDATLEEVRDFQRIFGSGANDAKPDKQGRITLPAELRSYAHLDKDIVVTGALDHVEIWNPDAWAAYKRAKEPEYSAINKVIGLPPKTAG